MGLTSYEYRILEAMAAHPGWVYSPPQLAAAVDPEGEASPLAVNVHISHLRSKLKAAGAPDLIVTVRGGGWRLRRPQGAAASEQAQDSQVFVGRESELTVLSRVLNSPAGHIGLVIGEAGAGKTSLIEHVLSSVAPRFEVVRAVCDGNGSGDHWLWRQVLGEIERRTGRSMAEHPNGHLVMRLLGATPVPKANALSGVDRTLAYDAVHGYLASVLPLHSRPVVVFVDDLQWADDASLTMLGYLLKRLATLPCCLLMASRSSDAESRAALGAIVSFSVQRGTGTCIRLEGLTAAEVAEFAQAVLGERHDAGLPDRLADRTGGNPLYLRECLMALSHSGEVDLERMITPSLGALVRSELSWLPDDTQRLLRYCAVTAAQFRPDLVADAADLPASSTAFDPALDSGTLVPASAGHLRFRHALVRDALIDDIEPATAEEMHLAIATAVARSTAVSDQAIFLLAHHLARAGASGRRAAIGYLVAAARLSSSSFAFEATLGHLSEALALLDLAQMEPRRAKRVASAILERLGGARSALADMPGAAQAYESAIASRPLEDGLARARLFTRLGHVRIYERKRAECVDAFCSGLAALANVQTRDAAWWRTWLELRLAQADAASIAEIPSPFADVRAELEAPLLEWGTSEQRVKYFVQLASDLCEQARWIPTDAAIVAARSAVGESETSGDDHLKSYAAIMLGSALVLRRDFAEADRHLRQALSLARRCADSMGEAASLFFLSMGTRMSGDLRMTEQHASELEGVAKERVPMPEMRSGAEACLGWVALRRGDYVEAHRRSECALQTWQQDPACSQSVWMMAWPAASCALMMDDLDGAIEYAALMTRPGQQALEAAQDARLADAIALHRDGQRDAARSLLESLESEARGYGYT